MLPDFHAAAVIQQSSQRGDSFTNSVTNWIFLCFSYADALLKALILSQYESSKEKTTTTKPDILSMVSEERTSASDIRQTIQGIYPFPTCLLS